MHRLVLLGAGHSHLVVIEQLEKFGLKNVKVTLISDVPKAPYSGMLSGYMAGIYGEDDLTIDLSSFSKRFKVELLIGKASSIDPAQQSLMLSTGEKVSYDCLSINTGILQSPVSCTESAQEKVIHLKPLSHFIPKWKKLIETTGVRVISVVGGGSAGFEVAQALSLRGYEEVHLITNAEDVLPELDQAAREKGKKCLRDGGVKLHLRSTALSFEAGVLRLSTGAQINCDYVFICTGAKALTIPGLNTDSDGYLLTDPKLQVEGVKNIFAAGDCINFNHQKLPKAGVYAVREGSILARNLLSHFEKKPLIPFKPQKTFLKIHLTGYKQALATKGRFCFQGRLAWELKDHLDRSFMKRFKER